MIHLELDSHDADLLRQTLLAEVSELRDEIARTDSQDFRERLKEKRRILERMADDLEFGRDSSGDRVGVQDA